MVKRMVSFTTGIRCDRMEDNMSTKKIEDAIREHLTGTAQVNALDFITFLQVKGAVFEDSANYFWHPQYKGH